MNYKERHKRNMTRKRRHYLHCAHFKSRGNWGTRFNPSNVAALCYGCHSYIDRDSGYKEKWFRKYLGEGLADLMVEQAAQPAYGIKKQKKEIAKHYREELKRLKQLRLDGVTGKIEIVGY